jgi:hypothetical protein
MAQILLGVTAQQLTFMAANRAFHNRLRPRQRGSMDLRLTHTYTLLPQGLAATQIAQAWAFGCLLSETGKKERRLSGGVQHFLSRIKEIWSTDKFKVNSAHPVLP